MTELENVLSQALERLEKELTESLQHQNEQIDALSKQVQDLVRAYVALAECYQNQGG